MIQAAARVKLFFASSGIEKSNRESKLSTDILSSSYSSYLEAGVFRFTGLKSNADFAWLNQVAQRSI